MALIGPRQTREKDHEPRARYLSAVRRAWLSQKPKAGMLVWWAVPGSNQRPLPGEDSVGMIRFGSLPTMDGYRHMTRKTAARTAALSASAVVALLLSSIGAAADPQPEAASVEQPVSKPEGALLDTVTVEAARERLERQISTFVSSITLRSWTESLARWQVPICPFVGGLPNDMGEFVRGRVSQIAKEAGVPIAPQDCAPNFIVVMTTEPEALLRKWWAQEPGLIDEDRGAGGTQRFLQTTRPVRVWYNACSGSPDAATSFSLKGGPRCSEGGVLGSRLTWGAVNLIYSAVVVVDLTQIRDLTIGQLTDYVAMIGLAEIRSDPALREAPTILNLFAETGTARPLGLSSWDQAFLRSLYATDLEKVTQLSDIKLRMARDLLP